MTQTTYTPPPGPQQPSKYGSVGPNYRRYGEQTGNGFYYDPGSDQYFPDPTARKAQLQAQGVIPQDPKPPGLAAQIGPIAGAAGALALGQGLGKDPVGFISGIGSGISQGVSKLGGAFNLGSSAAPAAAQGAANSGITAAGNAAWNAGADAATASSESGLMSSGAPALTQAPGAFSLGGIGSAGNVYLPAVGAMGAVDVLSHDYGPGRGALEGAASGAAIGSYFGPEGAAIGAGIGGAIGLGKGLFAHEKAWKSEQKSMNKLADSGAYVPPNLLDELNSMHAGRTKEQLVNPAVAPDFVGRDPQGNWTNNKFAQSRDEKDLMPEDIVNYSAFAQHDKDWFTKPLDQRLAIAKERLDAGAVKEAKGSIKVSWDK